MAVSLSNIYSLTALNSPTTKSQHPQFKTLENYRPQLRIHKPCANLCYSSQFRCRDYRSSFRSYLTAQDSAQQVNNDEGLPHDTRTSEEENQRQTPNLTALLDIYKDAILNGDAKTIAEVEALICTLENEKNELARKVSVFSAEIKSGKEKFIRLQADFDNFRKRSEKERLTTRSDAQGKLIESLLPMVDSFEQAKQRIRPETEKEQKIDTSYQGIYKQFVEVMRSLRVAPVPTVGKPFDPLIHEAISREESQDFKAGIVIQELRRGFRVGDKLLRPAMVKVSSGPGKKKATAEPVGEPASAEPIGEPATAAGLEGR